jgi:hypothetical protein
LIHTSLDLMAWPRTLTWRKSKPRVLTRMNEGERCQLWAPTSSGRGNRRHRTHWHG